MKNKTIILLMLLCCTIAASAQSVYDVTSFGAKGDGLDRKSVV